MNPILRFFATRALRAELARQRTKNDAGSMGWLLQVLQGKSGDGAPTGAFDLIKTATTYRAITRIASDLASVPLVIEAQNGAEWSEVQPGRNSFGDVAGVFARANRREGRGALWNRFHQMSLATGKAVLYNDYQIEGARPSPSQFPIELRAIRADLVEPVWPRQRGLFDDPIQYRYHSESGVDTLLWPEEVMYHVLPSVTGEYDALAPMDAGSKYAKVEVALVDYQREFFLNGARGTVALQTDMPLNEVQRQQFMQAWREEHTGIGNRFKMWLLTHGLKAVELSGRRDTDFIDLFRIVKEQVSMVYGVPPSFLSDFANSGVRANLDEQTPMYVEGTLMPLGVLLEQNLTQLELPRFDPQRRLRARLVWDALPMVQRMNFDRAKVFATLVGGPVMTPNDAREYMGLEPVEGGDVLIAQSAAPAPPEPGAPDRLPRAAAAASPRRKWDDSPARKAKRVAASNSLRRFEKPAETKFRAYFRDAEQRTVDAYLASRGKRASARRKAGGDFYDDETEIEILRNLLIRIYSEVMIARGPEAAAQVGGSASDFFIEDPVIQKWLRDHAYEQGVLISGTNKELVGRMVADAEAAGLSIQDIANAICDAFDVRRSSALTIARTETVRAHNYSTNEGWKATGLVDRVAWLTAEDDAVRSIDKGDEYDHVAMDGVEAVLGETFTVPGKNGDDAVEYPGDPNGQPGNTINCRCVLEPILERGERSVLVRRGSFAKIVGQHRLTNGVAIR